MLNAIRCNRFSLFPLLAVLLACAASSQCAASDLDELWVKFNFDAHKRYAQSDTAGAERALDLALSEAMYLESTDVRLPYSLLQSGLFDRILGRHAAADSLLNCACHKMHTLLSGVRAHDADPPLDSEDRAPGVPLRSVRIVLDLWYPEWYESSMLRGSDTLLLVTIMARMQRLVGNIAEADSLDAAVLEITDGQSALVTDCQEALLLEAATNDREAGLR